MLNLAERLNHSGVDLALFFGAAENWRRFVALGIAELSALVPLFGAILHLKDLVLDLLALWMGVFFWRYVVRGSGADCFRAF